MTGTPAPFEKLVTLDFPKELTNTKFLFKECENVVPENVIIIDKDTANVKIKELLLNGQKVIYFSNHTLTESSAREKFDLPQTVNIGVSFSNEKKRKMLVDDERNKIKTIESNLAKHSLIPDEIQLFVTTARNKEGINIHNKDIHNMFVETHLMYDAVQMAGRVREGIENFYIISNIEQFENDTERIDIQFSKKVMVKNAEYDNSADEANKYLNKSYLNNEEVLNLPDADRLQMIRGYVEYIEERFAFVRYNVFHQEFEYYYQKELAEKYVMQHINKFKRDLFNNEDFFVKSWFPNSNFRREISLVEKATIYLWGILKDQHYATISKTMYDHITEVLKGMLNTDLTSLNPILHLIDEKFNCERRGSDTYDLYYGETNPHYKKKPMKKRKSPRKKLGKS